MAFKIGERVKETTATSGTGTYSLDGAATGFQSFSAGIGNGNTCPYLCTDDTNWEVGIGTFATGTPNTLARTTVLASSNAGAAVNWSAGSKSILVTLPAALARLRSSTTSGLPAISDFSGVSAKSGAYTLTNADKGKLIDCSGTWTLSFNALSTFDADFWVGIVNNGTGTITLDPSGSEEIVGPGLAQAGATTMTLPYSGTTVGAYNVSGIVLCKKSSTEWGVISNRTAHGKQVFTGNGTWTCPEGVTTAWVSGCGGGGGGGGVNTNLRGGAGGGASGNSAHSTRVTTVPGTAYTVTVGTAGAAGSSAGGGGGSGGASSVGALITISGGGGGTGITVDGTMGAGGTSGTGGSDGHCGLLADYANTSLGVAIAGYGAGGPFGGGQGSVPTLTTQAGSAGTNYGGGGSGAASASASHAGLAGGAGGAGLVIIEW